MPHQFFCRPFRLVIRRSTPRTSSEKTKQEETADASDARRLKHVRSTLDVDALVGLRANLAVDARAVSDRAASNKCLGEVRGIGKIRWEEGDAWRGANCFVAAIYASCDENGLVSGGCKCTCQVPAHEAAASGNCDFHD